MKIIKLPQNILDIFQIFESFDAEIYLVGGSVRDLVLNKEPKDYDFTTDLHPEEVVKRFRKLGFNIVETGLKHGTVTLVYKKENYEITTYRTESKYSDYRRPDEVKFASNLFEDLKRRDFTINALAYNPQTGIIDYFDGIKDLNNKIINAVGNPFDRFNEDALRILRAVRFAAQLGFKIEECTYREILASRKNLTYVSSERIRDELIKILGSGNPGIGLRYLKDTGLMSFVIAELTETFDYDQCNSHHDKDLFEHTIATVENTPNNQILRLAALLHDIAKPCQQTFDKNGTAHYYQHNKTGADMTRKILTDLKFDNKTIEQVSILVYEHMTRFDKKPKDTALKKLINRVGRENLENLFELQKADILASAPPYDLDLINYVKNRCQDIIITKQPLTVKDLAVSGNDIMSLGIPQGAVIGEILKHMLEIVLENPDFNNKEYLMKFVKEGNFYVK